MRVDDFDFLLPDERIALRPASPRDSARLLVVRADGSLAHKHVSDLPSLLRPGDALVVNDTRVFPARLKGTRAARVPGAPDAGIEVTLHKRTAPDSFLAFARGARKLRPGDGIRFGDALAADVVARGDGGEAELRFSLPGAALDAAIARLGEMPLPPYIAGKRKPDARDRGDYQTVFARETVTLHVGAGTFLPVTAADTADHRMHSEWARLDADTAARLNAARAAGGRIVATGTTSLRTLESAAAEDGVLAAFAGETGIFITPGYRFRTAEILLTNFHLPRSTLFMLVCAFLGTEIMKSAYAEAIRCGYRFYSYGDACLLFR